jgi:hypothetical protein
MALSSKFYDGYVTESDQAKNRAGAPTYGVYGVNDFKVTAHPSIPFAVLVKAGRAWGHGVTDTADVDQVVQCQTLSGTNAVRWDLIVVRRNWQPALGGPSTLEVIQVGATPTIPGSPARKIGPGVEDDQPICLVQWQGGTSAPVGFIDLRTWVGDGGGLYADEDLVRTYLNALGTRIRIGVTDWVRMLGANDVPEWRTADDANTYSPNVVTNWETTGVITAKWFGLDRQVNVDLNFKRTGPDAPLTNLDLVPLSSTQNSLPIAARGNATSKYVTGWLVGGGNNIQIGVHLNPSTGVVSVRAINDPITIKKNAQFSLNLTYYHQV